ncbi:MAG: glycosyltransferase family 4 protein [Dehalococcoidia bacterium]
MKIGVLILGSLFKVGGYQVFAYNLMDKLVMRDHEVTLIVRSSEFHRNYSLYEQLPFSVATIKNSDERLVKYFPYFAARSLRNAINNNDIDVLQVVGSYPAGYVATYFKSSVPVALRTHGEDVQIDKEIGYGLRLDQKMDKKIRKVLHSVDTLIALTNTMSDTYKDLGIYGNNVSLVPNGVAVDDFNLGETFDSDSIRNKYNVKSDVPLLLTVGRYHKKKGFNLIPQIATNLRELNVDFKWLIVGNGTENIDPMIRHFNLEDLVTTVPSIGIQQDKSYFKFPGDDLIDLYKCADIYVFPSLLEGFPRVILEAMAASTPIVTTDAEGCVDLVEDGANGFVSNKNDHITMAENISKIIKDPTLMSKMAICSREKSYEYNWDIVVDKYEQIYRDLLLIK